MPYENLFVYHPKIKSNRLTWKEVCDWRNWSDIESIRREKNTYEDALDAETS